MANAHADQAREIGFNESVRVGGRELHVQTEVLGSQELLVRTTVYDGGTVRLAEKQVYHGDPSQLDELRAVVQEQHARNVQQLTESEACGAH